MTKDPSNRPDALVELREEIRTLRLEIERLRAKNHELQRSLNDRDFERPPHY